MVLSPPDEELVCQRKVLLFATGYEFQLFLVPEHGQIPTGADEHERNFPKRDRHKTILPRGVYGTERLLAHTLCCGSASAIQKNLSVNRGLGKELS